MTCTGTECCSRPRTAVHRHDEGVYGRPPILRGWPQCGGTFGRCTDRAGTQPDAGHANAPFCTIGAMASSYRAHDSAQRRHPGACQDVAAKPRTRVVGLRASSSALSRVRALLQLRHPPARDLAQTCGSNSDQSTRPNTPVRYHPGGRGQTLTPALLAASIRRMSWISFKRAGNAKPFPHVDG